MFQILIVEDDKELSQLFQKVLEKNGYQVKSASDGAEALEVLVKEYIDLIISDIMMPVMDGYELVSELRSAGYQIPVLMITAKGSFLIHSVPLFVNNINKTTISCQAEPKKILQS